ncbi:hypothetical protein HMPREF9074_09334 [Capnocytophaga sp. oral taxon 329 str. F0087]|nr:hypothetical protein HMPREF9074_09334 [Capnocytophaga sp. oral taxon 329 str. F0087]
MRDLWKITQFLLFLCSTKTKRSSLIFSFANYFVPLPYRRQNIKILCKQQLQIQIPQPLFRKKSLKRNSLIIRRKKRLMRLLNL